MKFNPGDRVCHASFSRIKGTIKGPGTTATKRRVVWHFSTGDNEMDYPIHMLVLVRACPRTDKTPIRSHVQ